MLTTFMLGSSLLQWGRTREGPEIRINQAQADRFRSFNGAGPVRVRRCSFTRAQSGTISASMGPDP